MKTRLRELVKAVPVFGKVYVQRDELRAIVNRLWEQPGHFYSPIPCVDEIRRKADRVFFADSKELGGIDLREDSQLTLFHELRRYYDDQPFDATARAGLRYFFDNPAFSYFDAIILHGMVRHVRPRRIIEVGSGYSSCVLLDTNELFCGGSIACTFIEPYPKLLYSLVKPSDLGQITVIASNLQDVDPSVFAELAAGDILFIDSSHVSKTNSDVNYVFFEILPRLASGVHVHFHDIFYPFEYPKEWVYQGRAWNEAYVLRAFLQYNAAFEIQLFNSFLEKFHGDAVARHMPLCTRFSHHSMMPTSAQSIWLRRR